MRKLLGLIVALTAASPAVAALPVGAKAPNFVTTGAMAGKPFQLNLKRELRKGGLFDRCT